MTVPPPPPGQTPSPSPYEQTGWQQPAQAAPPPAPAYQYPPSNAMGYGGPVEHPQGTLILILGILGLVAFQILGPFAWVMGNRALREIDANPAAYSNRSTVNAGRICGIIATVLLVLAIVFIVLILIGVVALSATSVQVNSLGLF